MMNTTKACTTTSRLVLLVFFCWAHLTVKAATPPGWYNDGVSPLEEPTEPADQELDCGMRHLFWELAQANVVSWRHDNSDIEEALELKAKCGPSASNTIAKQRSLRRKQQKDREEDLDQQKYALRYFVCPIRGDDTYHQEGNHSHPFRTLQRAIDTLEAQRAAATDISAALIVLLPGIHFLQKTVHLTPKHSNLTIRGHKGSWLSGGVKIPSDSTHWQPSPQNASIWVADIDPSIQEITGLFTIDPHTRLTLARYPNANVEEWDARDRYATIDTKLDDEWLFPPYGGVPDFTSYANLSDPHNPSGHVKNDSAMQEYNLFGTGIGGACATVWGDLPSYWCSNVSAGGWAFVDQAAAKAGRLNLPAGLKLSSKSPFQKRVQEMWNPTTVKGAIFHVAHSQGWAWHMFNVSQLTTSVIDDENGSSNSDAAAVTIVEFDKGGWQGGRNWECTDKDGHLDACDGDDKKLHGGPWYVEGILEELDVPGEFHWDANNRKLYLYPECNSDEIQRHTAESTCPPPDLIATKLKTLFKIEGTQDNPVQLITLENLQIRDAAKTFMEPWSAPSGGDWSLHRGGAIHLEGTENITISDCHFHRLDGNAIMIGGYNRYTTVRRSEFAWLGDGAIATWGDTDGYDATGGAQPRYSLMEHNVVSNIGLYEKQSSAWGQNKACMSVIRNNIMFNLPRAAINFNDGLGGGNLVEGNVIFNTCRESGDHGPINSWDRMPFLTDTTSSPSFAPLPTHTQHNIIWANHGASEGFDNDDGSSFYYTHDNVFYEADGFKMDYGGHSSKFFNNLVYTSDGRKKCYGTGSFRKGQADKFSNNTCILAQQKRRDKTNQTTAAETAAVPLMGQLFQCALYGMNPTTNRYFTASGNGTIKCGSYELTLDGMQKKGFEIGSVINPVPSSDTILSWARDILAAGFR